MQNPVEWICSQLQGDRADEMFAFIEYAQKVGLITDTSSRDDILRLCQRYWKEKSTALAVVPAKASVFASDSASFESVTGGLRSRDSYTQQTRDIIDLVTIQKGVMPVGTFKYNVHKYPSDIDILEKIDVCCSIAEAKSQVAKGIKRIGDKIRAAPDVFLGDFKGGKDERFEVDIGAWVPAAEATQEMPADSKETSVVVTVKNWLIGGDKGSESDKVLVTRSQQQDGEVLIGFNPRQIEKSVKRLRQERLISFEDLTRLTGLLSAMGKNPSKAQWEELQGLLRDHQVLRWNPQELSRGYKILPGFRKLTLEDALGQKTLVKIDAWANVNGRWMEVTNFFLITAVDALGRPIETLTQDMPDYEKSMANDVRHYAELGKTLKALKRLWMLSIFRGDYELADRINPIFNTPGAALNQIVGDAEVLAHMMAKLDDPPLEEVMQEIDGFKPRIDQMNRLPQYNEEFFTVINSIVEPFYARPVAEYNQFDQAVEGLEKLQDLITRVVEEMISQEAKERGFSNPGDFV